jgi:hypothetical protein
MRRHRGRNSCMHEFKNRRPSKESSITEIYCLFSLTHSTVSDLVDCLSSSMCLDWKQIKSKAINQNYLIRPFHIRIPMFQIWIHKQFNSSCFQEFLCTGWKPARLEKVKYDVIENLHISIKNKEESQRQKRRDEVDGNQKLADSNWN